MFKKATKGNQAVALSVALKFTYVFIFMSADYRIFFPCLNKIFELFITWFVDILSLEINDWHIYVLRVIKERKGYLGMVPWK